MLCFITGLCVVIIILPFLKFYIDLDMFSYFDMRATYSENKSADQVKSWFLWLCKPVCLPGWKP